jgi:hypothetical protein
MDFWLKWLGILLAAVSLFKLAKATFDFGLSALVRNALALYEQTVYRKLRDSKKPARSDPIAGFLCFWRKNFTESYGAFTVLFQKRPVKIVISLCLKLGLFIFFCNESASLTHDFACDFNQWFFHS